MSRTIGELAQLLEGTLRRGDPGVRVTRVAPTDQAGPDALTFVSKPDYLPALADTQAAAVLLSSKVLEAPLRISEQTAIIEVRDPYRAFAQASQLLSPPPPRPMGVHPSAVVDPSANVAPDAALGPFVYVGPGAQIGPGAVLYAGAHVEAGAIIGAATILYDHVVVRHGCVIGARCILHPGVVVGSDGFGFALGAELPEKIPQVGTVVVQDDVEIGANSCVDRGALGATVLGAGTKIDNLVQIGHNVVLGRGCILVAQSGIAGSSKLGNKVIVAAQAGVSGHLTIGDGVLINGQSGVMKDVPAGQKVLGTPAIGQADAFRNVLYVHKLRKLYARVKQLELKLFGEARE